MIYKGQKVHKDSSLSMKVFGSTSVSIIDIYISVPMR